MPLVRILFLHYSSQKNVVAKRIEIKLIKYINMSTLELFNIFIGYLLFEP